MKQFNLFLHQTLARILSLKFSKVGINFRFFPLNSNFSHETIIIGNNVYIGPHAWIRSAHGKIEIQDNVTIGPFFRIYGGDHVISYKNNTAIHLQKKINQDPKITIGRNSWIGGDVAFTKNGSIGSNCIVGAGSIVTRSFPNNVVIAGNPARVIKVNAIDAQ